MFDENQLPELCKNQALFGLRGFGGKTFRVNLRASYGNQVVVDVMTCGGVVPVNFSRASVAELATQVRPAPLVCW